MNKGFDEIFKDFLTAIQNQVTAAINESYKAGIESAKKNNSPKSEPRLLSKKEAAKFFAISIPTLDKYVSDGIIPAYRVGSNIRFKTEELSEVLIKRKFNN